MTLGVPLKLYLVNLFTPPSALSVAKNVIAALSAGLEARAGLIARVAPPELTVASDVTV